MSKQVMGFLLFSKISSPIYYGDKLFELFWRFQTSKTSNDEINELGVTQITKRLKMRNVMSSSSSIDVQRRIILIGSVGYSIRPSKNSAFRATICHIDLEKFSLLAGEF